MKAEDSKPQNLFIIGLGNPGKRYQYTIHNLGFLTIDNFITNLEDQNYQKKDLLNNQVFQFYNFQNQDFNLFLIKPKTFMNLSGTAILEIFYRYKIKNKENILVIHDDIDIQNNKIKLSINQSSAGHKGVHDIINKVGNGFWRIRIGGKGIIEDLKTIDAVTFNLKDKNEEKILNHQVQNATNILWEWIKKKIATS